jgi:hypothetical protein
VPSATRSSRITTTSCRTTRIQKEWEERGGTIILPISKQHTGGVTKKRGQPGWMSERPISRHGTISRFSRNPVGEKCARLARSIAVLVGEVRTYLGRRSSTCQREFCWQTPGGVSQNVPFFSADMRQGDSVQYHRHLLAFAKSGGQIGILRSEELPFH